MSLPNDRGLVVVRDEADGTKTVFICGNIVNGQPKQTFATHFRATVLEIDPALRMISGGATRYSHQIAEVWRDDAGVVHVELPAYA
jgi:hypothetical protein